METFDHIARRPWTTGELAELERCYATEPAEQIAARLNRTVPAVRLAAYQRHLVRAPGGRRRWSREEDFQLMQLYRNGMRIEQIAKELGRTSDSVRLRLFALRKESARKEDA